MSTSRVDAVDAFARIALHLHEGHSASDEVLDLIARSATELLRTDIAWLVLLADDGAALRAVVLVGFSTDEFLEVSLPPDRGIVGRALAQRSSVVVKDYDSYEHATSPQVRGAIQREGIRSLICSPLFRGTASIGALYVGRRRASTFSGDDVRLLEALAAQASVAIENHRLSARLREQNEVLDRSLRIHRQFTDAALRGLGLEGIAATLAQLIGHPVRIVPAATLGLPAVTAPAEAGPPTGRPPVRHPVDAGGRVVGTLEVLTTGPLSRTDVTAVEHARTVCGLELVKLELAAEVEGRYRSRLLDDVLDGSVDGESLRIRARRIAVDLSQPFRMVVMRVDVRDASSGAEGVVRLALQQTFGTARSRILLTERNGALLIAVPAALEDHAQPLVDCLTARLQDAGSRGSVGVGAQTPDLRSAHASAEACSAFGARNGGGASLQVIWYDRLGLMNFLLDAPDVEHTAAGVTRALAPLWSHDRGSRMQLTPTLREYLAADGHHVRTCQRLYIGVTTLKYRLSRIEELLDVDLRDGTARFELRLALQLADVLDAQRRSTTAGPVG